MFKKPIFEGTINKTNSGEKQLFRTPQEVSTGPTQKSDPGVVLGGGGEALQINSPLAPQVV